MGRSGVVKLAQFLKVLVSFTFLCNLLVLPLVPGVVGIGALTGISRLSVAEFFAVCWQYLWRVWGEEYAAVLSVFLLFCGTCTAITLWQARGVLDTIVREDTFTMPNARRLKRAAVCCLLVSATALVRTVWGLFYYRSLAPIFTYNTVFIPVAFMGGLLCMVMSALFRQAAELKEENDLTI
ncbi:conserved membrane hypothetical protein [uncultured Eubacteriales bacterium]|uniref:DUF2975 domain-containing protein n=1 Tax=uncultured Eubacteriales bacterium TaxID=172733 RepID=A0A212K4B0_9FIRM|nr:conserved membrane hypothetical protein [uncultured Eubacteriales bacterium]